MLDNFQISLCHFKASCLLLFNQERNRVDLFCLLSADSFENLGIKGFCLI